MGTRTERERDIYIYTYIVSQGVDWDVEPTIRYLGLCGMCRFVQYTALQTINHEVCESRIRWLRTHKSG